MAFNSAPTTIFPSYAATSTDLTIPLAALPNLSSAEANASTGDSRELLRSILDTAYNSIQALPEADRPKKMTITKATPQVVSTNVLRISYTVSFDVSYMNSALSMSAES